MDIPLNTEAGSQGSGPSLQASPSLEVQTSAESHLPGASAEAAQIQICCTLIRRHSIMHENNWESCFKMQTPRPTSESFSLVGCSGAQTSAFLTQFPGTNSGVYSGILNGKCHLRSSLSSFLALTVKYCKRCCLSKSCGWLLRLTTTFCVCIQVCMCVHVPVCSTQR